MNQNKITIKDIVFIAVLSAALTLAGMITMPLVMTITLFGLRNMVSAVFYSLFAMLGIMRVEKKGTLTLIGLFHAFVLLMMAPVMFFSISSGALFSELITLIIFKNYSTDKSKVLASMLFIPLTLPTTLIFTMAIHGMSFLEVIEKPFISVVFTIATIVLSYVGAKLGQKLGYELKKAGKL
jgi:hypothetical protein